MRADLQNWDALVADDANIEKIAPRNTQLLRLTKEIALKIPY
jgi:hypothetical protein